MLIFPKAKVNIGLYVKEKRSDGFHNIETVFYPVGLSDILEVVTDPRSSIPGISLKVTGIEGTGEEQNNLVAKAYTLLADRYQVPSVTAHLHKFIPVGAGLGGGSSDGAAMLRLINKMFSLDISPEELTEIALELGSDCPFFINQKPVLATGRGEIFTPVEINLDGLWWVILYPEQGINTGLAYQNTSISAESHSLLNAVVNPVVQWKKKIRNDFEEYAISVCPLINVFIEKLYESGALFASLTGSGSAVYGIFEKKIPLPDELKPYLVWQGVD